jgi:hypothetical protein
MRRASPEPRRGQIAGEGPHPVPVDRIPVGHEQGGDALLGDRLDGVQHVGDPRPADQRAVHRIRRSPGRPLPGRSTASRSR